MTQTIDALPHEVRSLTVQDTGPVALPVPVDQVIQQWQEYQELTRRLLDDSDYQSTGSGPNAKRFKKKSAWRKYSRAFNLTDRVVFEHVERAPDGWPLWARVRVEASAPNGRSVEADHECHVTERCCDAALGAQCAKRSWSNHVCCPVGCTGRQHWGHPGDIAATATTRAKNRAISDLIGAGEVSAEEMEGQPQNTPQTRQEPRRAARAATTADESPPDRDADEDGSVEAPKCGCGNFMVLLSGEKNGKKWRGWMCSKKWAPEGNKPAACQPRWVNE
jgi:hypothetical protein